MPAGSDNEVYTRIRIAELQLRRKLRQIIYP